MKIIALIVFLCIFSDCVSQNQYSNIFLGDDFIKFQENAWSVINYEKDYKNSTESTFCISESNGDIIAYGCSKIINGFDNKTYFFIKSTSNVGNTIAFPPNEKKKKPLYCDILL